MAIPASGLVEQEWAGADVKSDSGPIGALILQAQKGLESLHGSLARLEDRLSSGLREEMETPEVTATNANTATITTRSVQSPLHRDLEGIVRRIGNAEKRVEEIRDRCEL